MTDLSWHCGGCDAGGYDDSEMCGLCLRCRGCCECGQDELDAFGAGWNEGLARAARLFSSSQLAGTSGAAEFLKQLDAARKPAPSRLNSREVNRNEA